MIGKDESKETLTLSKPTEMFEQKSLVLVVVGRFCYLPLKGHSECPSEAIKRLH